MARITGSDGYVTLAVLVLGALLAAVVSTLLTLSLPSLDLARIGADELAVDGLLDGGVTAAGYMLFSAKSDLDAVDGTELSFGGGGVSLAVADEGARIDLNWSDAELIEGIFEAVGGTSMSPSAFAARVEDWRDEDDDTGVNGAESQEYSSAGLGYTPRNGPFRSIEELHLLLGLSADDFGRLAPYVTVYNMLGTIDPLTASRTALMAIPEISEREVKDILKARARGEKDREVLMTMVLGRPEFLGFEPSGVYRVTVKARLKGGLARAAEAVIAAPKQESGSDYGVVAWSRIDPAERAP